MIPRGAPMTAGGSEAKNALAVEIPPGNIITPDDARRFFGICRANIIASPDCEQAWFECAKIVARKVHSRELGRAYAAAELREIIREQTLFSDESEDAIQAAIASAFKEAERRVPQPIANGHAVIDEEPPPPSGPENYGLSASDITENNIEPAALIQTSAQFIRGFIPPDYLVDGISQRRFIYSLTGRTGSGKSAIVLLLAASVALGRPIGSREVQKGRVLYFAGENPDDIRMRWIAMAQHMNFEVDYVDVCFIAGTFKISEMAARVVQEAQIAGPFALVVVDTSAAFFEGDDENSNAQAGSHARRLRSLVDLPGGPCVVVNCHPPKNTSADNLQPRGGGAFIAEMDGNLTARNADGVVELHWQGKFRGPDFAPMSFQLNGVTNERLKDTKGRTIPTVIASYLSETARDAIAEAARGNENLVLAQIAADPGKSYAHIARDLGWLLRDGSPNKMRVSRVVTNLKTAKLVTIERDKPVITDKGEKLLAGVTAKHAESKNPDP